MLFIGHGVRFWIAGALLVFLLYSPVIHGPYILDDSHTLQSNAIIQNFSGLRQIWSTGRAYSSLASTYGYRPVTTTFNMLIWVIGGGQTWPFHLAKILIFIATCSLLARIWRELMPSMHDHVLGAGILLFAVNPVHSQVVSYIAAIATQWAALFVCLAIWAYLRHRRDGGTALYILSLVFVALATLSKEEGVVALALIPLVEIYLRKMEGRRLWPYGRVGVLLGYLLPAGVAVFLIFWMYEPTQDLVRSEVRPWRYFITQWRAYLRYFAMYFYSYDLNADNIEFGFASQFRDKAVLRALSLNVAVISAALLSWRWRPAITLGVAWFYIGISPASSVVVLAEPVNDHRAFIGYLGFALVGLVLLELLFRRDRRIFWIAVTVATTGYSITTYRRGEAWSTNAKLWTDTVKKNPSSARAHNNLGLEMIRRGEFDFALILLKRCAELRPTYAHCHINRGVALAKLGRDDEAESEFLLGVKFDQTVVQSRYNYARFLSARGILSRAVFLVEEADRFVAGHDLDTRLELIDLYRRLGERERAKRLLAEAFGVFGAHPRLERMTSRLDQQ